VAVGVGALLTKKKLKCNACGEYNDTGNAKPYKGPASTRLGKKFGTFVKMHGVADGTEVEDDDASEGVADATTDEESAPVSPVSVADELNMLLALRDAGVLSDEEFDAQKAKLLG
jgi:Short C-terminal domain